MSTYEPIINQVMSPEMEEKMRPIDKLVVEHLRRSRQLELGGIEKMNAVAELLARAVFLQAGGKVPKQLQKAVQEIVTPNGQTVEESDD